MKDIYREACDLKQDIIAWRRHFHANPETGTDQPETVAFVCRTLTGFGLEPRELGGGVVCLIEGERPGKTLLLRADMDALPLDEESGLPFCSKRAGINHACGHDMHTAMLLGAAKILSERRSQICGCVKLMFQPAEELGLGAERMIDAGLLENPKVDAAMGIHMAVALDFPTGTMTLRPGATLASNDMFTITVNGRGSHGARPETAIDPINIICHIHSMLQTINSREITQQEVCVLTIGQISGGQTPNSIPDAASMRGTIRTLRNEDRALARKRLVEIAEGTAATLGGRAEVAFTTGMPALINDEAMALEMEGYLREMLGDDGVGTIPLRLGSEDFARVTAAVPGVFMFLSGGSRQEGYTTGSHNPKVLYNEDSLPVGAASHAHCAIRWLENHSDR